LLDSILGFNQNSFETLPGFGLSRVIFAVPPLPQCEISVVIPVRDEAENLHSTLRAVTRQVDLAGVRLDPRRFEILVLANNCTDNSASVVRQWQSKTSLPPIHLSEVNLPSAEANCGRARQIVMEAAFLRLKKLGRKRGVIASTDGDTRVASDWVAATLLEINRGADAVSGRIMIEPDELTALDKKTRLYHLRDVYYRHLVAELESYLAPVSFDPRPRHHQHFNASFAVTVEAFERAGGVPAVKYLEDFAFYNSLLRIDARFRHSPQVRVFTSARQHGRTTCGLSTQLTEWNRMSEGSEFYFVESLDELETSFGSFHQLGQFWRQMKAEKSFDSEKFHRLAESLCIGKSWLKTEMFISKTFGRLRQTVERKQRENGIWRARYSLVSVEEAITSLRLRLEVLRRSN